MATRKTLAKSVNCTATGVQSGQQITLALHPASAGTGLKLIRSDIGQQWPVNPPTAFAAVPGTAVGNSEYHVLFVEHLLAALAAAAITDLTIEVSGAEIPLFEGGAVKLWQMIQAGSIKPLDSEIAPVVLSQAVIISTVDYFLCAIPNDTTEYYYLYSSHHPLIGHQWASFVPATDDFARDLAPARTFIAIEEAEAARQAGMLKGGSTENAIVIYPDRLSETPALPQAFARHKLLDLMGDLYLLGRPLQAHIIGSRSGHQQNHQLVQRLAEISEHEGNPALR
ncbi:MAG: UDP-3-O-[3-hydroxymyristoyl] N-acetylglucosamine deacetylase [Armatimonadetes bacterium]|nr:UDP-3-O-[3-hydroxymyristoyl] N-acetylglucosamine deacetylase [Armatimonadota bacterium]